MRLNKALNKAPLLLAVVIMLPMFAAVSGASQRYRDKSNVRRHVSARTTWDSVFTATQASRGESTYTKTCARCHQSSLAGADEAPALTGAAFMSGWNGQSLGDLHTRIMTSMPTDTPGTYKRTDVADVIAYVLNFNAFPAGKTELPNDDAGLKAIQFVTSKP